MLVSVSIIVIIVLLTLMRFAQYLALGKLDWFVCVRTRSGCVCVLLLSRHQQTAFVIASVEPQ